MYGGYTIGSRIYNYNFDSHIDIHTNYFSMSIVISHIALITDTKIIIA